MSQRRPQLDQLTLWRAETVARQENRTLPSAIAVLIGEAWDRRHNVETGRCVGLHLDAPADGEARTIGTHLPVKIIARIERIAELEQRSVSQVVRLLVAEALASRGVMRAEGGAVEAAVTAP